MKAGRSACTRDPLSLFPRLLRRRPMDVSNFSRSSRPGDERRGGDKDGRREHRSRMSWTEETQERFCKSLQAKQSRGRTGLGYGSGGGATSSAPPGTDLKEFFVRGLESVYEQAALENRTEVERKRARDEGRRCEARSRRSQNHSFSGRGPRRSASTSTSTERFESGRKRYRRETKRGRDSSGSEARGRRRCPSRGSSVETLTRSRGGRSPSLEKIRAARDRSSLGRSGTSRSSRSLSSSRRRRTRESKHLQSIQGSRWKSSGYLARASEQRETVSRSPEARRVQNCSGVTENVHHGDSSSKHRDTRRSSSPNSYGESRRCSNMPVPAGASNAPPQSAARTRDFDKGNRFAHVQTSSNDEPDFERHYSVATSTRHTSQSQSPSGDPATHALRERVRERLKAAESAWRSSNLGTDKCPKTGREGWLATVKAMIDEESKEAADDSKWDTMISKQEEREDRIKIQALIDQEDETVFSSFLKKRRQGNQQRSDLNQASSEVTMATRHQSASTGSSSGVAAEASHLEAIFGAGSIQASIPKQAVDPIPSSESSRCQVTATVAGVNGVALLADSVLMQSGHTGAAWKRRRQLSQRTYVP
ncbi:hypothetical protein TGPRC2_299670 [Toxoplasma gondii TgCatPRC2]|uniref:Uncharacterized protein n=1 Tax=Toxoplasma gondii TgCatPRC2 TaxID=1130821 RepID=A0A151H0B8_TOXGO|nr:hypothetical protein TGPRC2_299670 [Toxoplasma gondii TgCatPRC2]